MPCHAYDHLPCTAHIKTAIHLLAHGAGSPLAKIGFLGLGLGDTLGENLGIFILLKLLAFLRITRFKSILTAASLALSALRRLSAMR
jgi:hypothetical protein